MALPRNEEKDKGKRSPRPQREGMFKRGLRAAITLPVRATAQTGKLVFGQAMAEAPELAILANAVSSIFGNSRKPHYQRGKTTTEKQKPKHQSNQKITQQPINPQASKFVMVKSPLEQKFIELIHNQNYLIKGMFGEFRTLTALIAKQQKIDSKDLSDTRYKQRKQLDTELKTKSPSSGITIGNGKVGKLSPSGKSFFQQIETLVDKDKSAKMDDKSFKKMSADLLKNTRALAAEQKRLESLKTGKGSLFFGEKGKKQRTKISDLGPDMVAGMIKSSQKEIRKLEKLIADIVKMEADNTKFRKAQLKKDEAAKALAAKNNLHNNHNGNTDKDSWLKKLLGKKPKEETAKPEGDQKFDWMAMLPGVLGLIAGPAAIGIGGLALAAFVPNLFKGILSAVGAGFRADWEKISKQYDEEGLIGVLTKNPDMIRIQKSIARIVTDLPNAMLKIALGKDSKYNDDNLDGLKWAENVRKGDLDAMGKDAKPEMLIAGAQETWRRMKNPAAAGRRERNEKMGTRRDEIFKKDYLPKLQKMDANDKSYQKKFEEYKQAAEDAARKEMRMKTTGEVGTNINAPQTNTTINNNSYTTIESNSSRDDKWTRHIFQ